jgi:hypothetical protein
LVIFMVTACAEKVIEAPENLIPKDKMADILHDLAVLNATKSTAENKFKDSGIDIMQFLYDKYGIDSVQFSESDLYYASIPLEYQTLYETVKKKLDDQAKIMEDTAKAKNESVRKANEARKDSIEAIKDSMKVKQEKKKPVLVNP